MGYIILYIYGLYGLYVHYIVCVIVICVLYFLLYGEIHFLYCLGRFCSDGWEGVGGKERCAQASTTRTLDTHTSLCHSIRYLLYPLSIRSLYTLCSIYTLSIISFLCVRTLFSSVSYIYTLLFCIFYRYTYTHFSSVSSIYIIFYLFILTLLLFYIHTLLYIYALSSPPSFPYTLYSLISFLYTLCS